MTITGSKTALVIAGHGSHLSAQTAAPAWQHADAIRAMGVFDEVTCAFWKEAPSLHRVLDTLTADDITIVPLFTSQGYFSRTVLPSEFQLEGPITQRGNRIIRYTETVGQHPHMTDVVRARVEAVLAQFNLDPAQTALALAGHGTRRDRESAAATQKQADSIRAEGRFAEVVTIYMEEPPEVSSIYEITHSQSIIIVPFFVADGSHTQEDIPTDLRLSPDPRRLGYSVPAYVEGRAIYYTPAVGMESTVANVILELAYDAGAPRRPQQKTVNQWTGFPQAGLDALKEVTFPFEFGQLYITHNADHFTIHHKDDPSPAQYFDSPTSLRNFLNRDANGNFRALRTGTDLCQGWRVNVESVEALLAVLETIYPSVWIDYVQYQQNKLPVQTIEQVASRQTGMYKRVGKLSVDDLPVLVKAHCSGCVRTATWAGIPTPIHSAVPCPEPCQCFMSFALEQIDSIQRESKHTLEVSTSELESLKVALHAAIDHPESDVRPSEYTDPRNPARLKVLLERLGNINTNSIG